MSLASFYHWYGDSLILRIKVSTRARQSEIMEAKNDILNVRIKAPPVDGKANQALIGFLAKLFKVHKRQVTITHGHTNIHKLVSIETPKHIPEYLQINSN